MKPLIVLAVVFLLSSVISKITTGNWNTMFCGNLAMFVMLCFTALGHFMFTKGMVMMIPGFIPLKRELVYFTGVVEVALGLALLFPSLRSFAGVALVILFLLMLPANVHAAFNHIDYEKGSYDGEGPAYLWFRVPLQFLFIAWVWFFSIKNVHVARNWNP